MDVDVDVDVEVEVDVVVDVDVVVGAGRMANLPTKLHVVVPVAAGGTGGFPCAEAMPVPTAATRPLVSATAASAEISLRDIPRPPTSSVSDERRPRRALRGLILHVAQTVHKGARQSLAMN